MNHSKQIEILKPTRFGGEAVDVGTVMTVGTAMAVDLVARERARIVEPGQDTAAAVTESEVVVEPGPPAGDTSAPAP